MTFDTLFSVIGDNQKAKALISNISSDTFEVPFLMQKTVEMLSDQSPYLNFITDGNKQALANMILMHFNSCWNIFIDDYKLEDRIKYAKMEIYKIVAPNGLRYATAKEVSQGVKGLMAEYAYPAGEDNYKRICLMQWTFTGVNYYFREAGFKLTYENSKEPKESLYEMIVQSKDALVDLFRWTEDTEEFEKAIKKIDKMKKNKGYKYASYEQDEIDESISIKQLIYNIDKTFPRNSEDVEYRRAIALVIKGKNNIQLLSPLDISFLRKVYDKRALERSNKDAKSEVDLQLKTECELLLSQRYSGKIREDHFAYKIIQTLKQKGYKNCSKKQYDILKDALNELNKHENKDEIEESNKRAVQTILDDAAIDSALLNGAVETDILNISDALGNGLFDEED